MPQLLVIGLICSFLLFPASLYASEDMDFIMFGDEVPLDENMFSETEEFAPALQSTVSSSDEFVFTYPNADSASDNPQEDLSFQTQSMDSNNKLAEVESKPLDINVDDSQSLTANLEQDNNTSKISIPNVEETWVGKLTITNPLTLLSGDEKQGDATLEQMVSDARETDKINKKSNASVFDISGVMLRMGLKQVDRTMQNRGFRKVMQKYQIPNFIKWRNEELCRNSGVVGYERIEACITDRAKKDKHQYVQTAQYIKYDTKEDIEVTFSSNFTDNKVYKIVYKSQAANITGNSPKAIYLRNIKIYDFWKKINQKYGKPDNKSNVTWGMGGNKPFLKAATGYLKLEDPMLRELDYTRMSREDQRYMNTDLYSF